MHKMIDKYISKEVSDGVAFLYLDQQDSKVNIVSPSLIDVFDQIIDQIISDDCVKAAVFISTKKDFIAGADIQSFKAEKVGDFQPISRKGHLLLSRLENSPKPFVAAIHVLRVLLQIIEVLSLHYQKLSWGFYLAGEEHNVCRD